MRRIAILLGASLALAEPAGAQGFETVRIASGLAEPIFLTAPPDDPDRAFVVERAGQIRIIRLPGFDLEATPFLTIAGVDTTGEGGLLGLAFHPDYATNGFFYVCFTIDDDEVQQPSERGSFATRYRPIPTSPIPRARRKS